MAAAARRAWPVAPAAPVWPRAALSWPAFAPTRRYWPQPRSHPSRTVSVGFASRLLRRLLRGRLRTLLGIGWWLGRRFDQHECRGGASDLHGRALRRRILLRQPNRTDVDDSRELAH